ncbi:MAG: hypothetical protein CMQ38_11000 [Gammaproteobacteria bacterium]|nr:hypothetical protein [Gammaproteobacteria bacterium]
MKKLICLMFLFCSLVANGQQQELIDFIGLKNQAESAFQQRNSEQVVALYEELSNLIPDDAEILYRLSLGYQWNDNYAAALQAGAAAYEAGYREPASMAYRLARLSALLGQQDEALAWLEISLAKRLDDRPSIYDDPAFSSLRSIPAFLQLSGVIANAESMNRNEGLEYDLDYLIEEAQRMHAAPERPAFSDEFLGAVENLRERIPDITGQQFYLEVMKLVAILDDGHSAIYTPDGDSPLEITLASLPLKFFWFDDGMYIVDGLDGNEIYAGSEVLQVEDLLVTEVMARLSEFRGVDNTMTWRWMGPQFYLGRAELLNAVGASESIENITLTLRTLSGAIQTVEIQSGDYDIPRKLRVSPAMTGDVPLYLSDVDTNYWMEIFPESNTLYFQFNQVRDSEQQNIAGFSELLSQNLESNNIEHLIVDVRHNNGGNNSLFTPLVEAIIAFDQVPDHKTYIITGRNTFSAAQNFINHIERWTDAVFVGKPSASSPNFTGEETSLLLPYSRIRGSISTRYWQDSNPGDERQWIAPDVPVTVTAVDYFAGRDAALEYILGAIESGD